MFQKAFSPQPAPDSHSIPFYLVGVDRVWPEKLDQNSNSPQERTWHPSKPVVSGLGICIHSEFKSLTQQDGLFTFMALPHFLPQILLYIMNGTLLQTTIGEGQRFTITP